MELVSLVLLKLLMGLLVSQDLLLVILMLVARSVMSLILSLRLLLRPEVKVWWMKEARSILVPSPGILMIMLLIDICVSSLVHPRRGCRGLPPRLSVQSYTNSLWPAVSIFRSFMVMTRNPNLVCVGPCSSIGC